MLLEPPFIAKMSGREQCMHLVDHKTFSPEENLAIDELLLAKAERGEIPGTIRFWETGVYSVVLGRSSKVEENCYLDRCTKDGIRVLRRISGGGTVLQGPGCINYSVISGYPEGKGALDIRVSYSDILGRISSELNREGVSAEVYPISDIAVKGKKISGNAQVRKKRFFLHHGTVLLPEFDICMLEKYIKHPADEPDYREKRFHRDFVGHALISRDRLFCAIKRCFPIEDPAFTLNDLLFTSELSELVYLKYSNNSWNLQF